MLFLSEIKEKDLVLNKDHKTKPIILLIIGGDPRVSIRAADAIKMASEILSWKNIQLIVYLKNAAALLLHPTINNWIGHDVISKSLPLLIEHKCQFLVEQSNPFLREISGNKIPFKTVTATEFAAIASDSKFVIRF